jgi:hypothetical protein
VASVVSGATGVGTVTVPFYYRRLLEADYSPLSSPRPTHVNTWNFNFLVPCVRLVHA